jgi:hypothetical protein
MNNWLKTNYYMGQDIIKKIRKTKKEKIGQDAPRR